MILDQYIQFMEDLVSANGPEPEDYYLLDLWISKLYEDYIDGRLDQNGLDIIRGISGDAFSEKTMQGASLIKKYGYAGDFEIMDKIYMHHITDDETLKKWDLYFHSQDAPKAVRNRKSYFKKLLQNIGSQIRCDQVKRALNLASGSAKEFYEYYSSYTDSRIYTDCVDIDQNAIAYAKKLFKDQKNISFYHFNVFRYVPKYKYDLILAAGLFDYLNDRQFIFLLRRYLEFIADRGEIVIGNFSNENSTRYSMEVFLNWTLYHRTMDNLKILACESGANIRDVHIGNEDEGINLFLHIKKGDKFYSLISE